MTDASLPALSERSRRALAAAHGLLREPDWQPRLERFATEWEGRSTPRERAPDGGDAGEGTAKALLALTVTGSLFLLLPLIPELTAPLAIGLVMFAIGRRREKESVDETLSVEALVEAVASLRGPAWSELAARIEDARREMTAARAVTLLDASESWTDALVAYVALERRPWMAGPSLRRLAARSPSTGGFVPYPMFGPGIRFSIHASRQLVRKGDRWPGLAFKLEELVVCSRCIARGSAIRVDPATHLRVWGRMAACRRCGSPDHLVEQPVSKIVARLGGGADEWPAAGSSVLRVAAEARRRPFDFDEVRLLATNDADVESFCILVSGDEDRVQRKRSRKAPVHVGEGLELSDNTLAMLDRTFGTVRGPTRGS